MQNNQLPGKSHADLKVNSTTKIIKLLSSSLDFSSDPQV